VGKPNAMGIHEIALRLGVSKSRARQLVAGKNFPDGVRLHQGWIWSTEDVEAWVAMHRPTPAGQDETAPGA
jgi:prophage regulatory protein